VAELQATRRRGEAAVAQIAERVGGDDPRRVERVQHYLRDNLNYALGEREIAGLRRFHQLAAEQGLVPGLRPLRFY
jgi:predicted solute-binding protein